MNEGTALKMDEVIDSPYHPFKTQKAKEDYFLNLAILVTQSHNRHLVESRNPEVHCHPLDADFRRNGYGWNR